MFAPAADNAAIAPANGNGRLIIRLILAALVAELLTAAVGLLFMPPPYRLASLMGNMTHILVLTGFLTAATITVFTHRFQQRRGRSGVRHPGVLALGLALTMLVWGQLLQIAITYLWRDYWQIAGLSNVGGTATLGGAALWLVANWGLQLIHVLVPLWLILAVSSAPRHQPVGAQASGRSVAAAVALIEATLACGVAGALIFKLLNAQPMPELVLLPGALLPWVVYVVMRRGLPASMPFPGIGVLLLNAVMAGLLASGIGLLLGRLLFALLAPDSLFFMAVLVLAAIGVAILVRALLAHALAIRLARRAK